MWLESWQTIHMHYSPPPNTPTPEHPLDSVTLPGRVCPVPCCHGYHTQYKTGKDTQSTTVNSWKEDMYTTMLNRESNTINHFK